ncbi:MAG: PKD domain-containing protein [Candidatus Bathyarchaeia archaeon]
MELLKKITSKSMMLAMIVGMLIFVYDTKFAEGWTGTVYIKADGSIYPPTANITTLDKIIYNFTGDFSGSIVIERDNIILDGAGHVLQGTDVGVGIYLSDRNNVTIKNVNIKNFECGVWFDRSYYNNIINSSIMTNLYGVRFCSSSHSNILMSNIKNNAYGVWFDYSSYNNILRSNVRNNLYGIEFDNSHFNSILGSSLVNNDYNVWFDCSSCNNILGCEITNGSFGIWFYSYSSGNKLYHNNFINNTQHVRSFCSTNVWDDSYPSGGNYWSDYVGIDLYNGPYQNITGSDGIGDVPYIIDEKNVDIYPLMKPWGIANPIASFVWFPAVPEVGELVTFDASASMPNGGEIASYIWNFGDGNYTSGKVVTHIYSSTGNYTITLNVTDSEGLWDIEQKQIEVKAPPSLNVSISPLSALIFIGQSVTFTSTVSGGLAPYSYQWYLNDNPVSGANQNNWTFTPTKSGIHYVYLKVTDARGDTAQSEIARVKVAFVQVGGRSTPMGRETTSNHLTLYLAIIMAILITSFMVVKCRTESKQKNGKGDVLLVHSP